MSLFVAHFRRRTNVGFWVLADLIIDDDGVSACDAGYVCFLCFASGVDTLVKDTFCLKRQRRRQGASA
jgi:hypothetical protein